MEDLAITFAQLTIRRPPDRPQGTFSRFELLNEDVIRIIFANFVPRGTLRARDQRYLTSNIFPDITATSVRELRKCLHALCLTSKRFYAIAHPLLYRVLIIKTHYEMALLFRTFTATTRLRSLVKTFAWVPDNFIPLSLRDEIESTAERAKMLAIQQDIGLHWPISPGEKEIARKILKDSVLPWGSEAVLTAVLGMLEQVRTLCLVSGYAETPDWPENESDTIGIDWVQYSLGALLTDGRGETFGFLQNLDVFSIEDKTDVEYEPRGSLYLTASLVVHACPKLRRVEYMTKMDEINRDFLFDVQGEKFSLGPYGPLSTSVEEVVVAFGSSPMAELPRILRVLPNLKVFRGEFCVTTADTDSTQTPAGMSAIEETNAPGSWHDTRMALLEVKNTLTELHLTTRRDTSWRGWDNPQRPLLWTTISNPKLGRVLPQMSFLTSLTIEPIWLFDFVFDDNNDTYTTPDIFSLLPPSLKKLHLVDYWGVAYDKSFERADHYQWLFNQSVARCGLVRLEQLWTTVVTDMVYNRAGYNRAGYKGVSLKKVIISSPLEPYMTGWLRNPRFPGGGDRRSLFYRSKRVGLSLVVQNIDSFTSIPKEEWTCLEGYLD